MTIQEKARELAKKEYPILADGPIAREKEKTIHDKIYRAYLAGAAGAMEWVPVSERLPEERKWCLVYVPERKMAFMAYCNEFGLFESPFPVIELGITHWMPLPPHPEK